MKKFLKVKIPYVVGYIHYMNSLVTFFSLCLSAYFFYNIPEKIDMEPESTRLIGEIAQHYGISVTAILAVCTLILTCFFPKMLMKKFPFAHMIIDRAKITVWPYKYFGFGKSTSKLTFPFSSESDYLIISRPHHWKNSPCTLSLHIRSYSTAHQRNIYITEALSLDICYLVAAHLLPQIDVQKKIFLTESLRDDYEKLEQNRRDIVTTPVEFIK